MKYLAYFQAFTNTYASFDKLKALYEEALGVENVVGIVIGTRPDCVSTDLLDYLQELSSRTFVLVEYGIETTNDETLMFINRGHDFECSRKAVEETKKREFLPADMSSWDCRVRMNKKASVRPVLYHLSLWIY